MMKVKRNWTMKQEQNAILKRTFRERSEVEGGRKREEDDKEGEIKTLQQTFLKIKTEWKGKMIKLRKAPRSRTKEQSEGK